MSLTRHPAEIVEASTSPLLAKHSDWPRAALGSVAEIQNGAAFKSTLFDDEVGMPLIRIRDLGKSVTSMRYRGEFEERYLVHRGQLLVGMDGDFRVARWQGEPALLNQRVCRITPDPRKLDIDFLTHILPGYLEAIQHVTSSTTVRHLSSKDIARIPLPLPTLSEQRRIATCLDEIEGHCASVAANLESARVALDQSSAAVLAAGCAGRLTADWRAAQGRPADLSQQVQELRADVSLKARAVSDLPEGWGVAQVGEVAEVMLGGTPARREPAYWDGDIPWVSSGEVANCRITNTREGITQAGLDNSNAKLHPPGTVLLAMIGEGKTRGQSAILDLMATTNQNVAAINVNREFLDPEFVWRWARAQYASTRAAGRGGNQAALNQRKVRELIIPLPPLEEQTEVVRRIDSMLTQVDQMREKIAKVQKTLDQVSSSSRGKAFRGALAPTKAAALAGASGNA